MITFKGKYSTYILFIAFTLAVGGVSALLSRNGIAQYRYLVQPPLSPPALLFPIVWTVLYTLMGISASIIWNSKDENKETAIVIYAVQLAVNFLWPIFFFVFEARFLAFLWLLLLIFLVFLMIKHFCEISSLAAWLQLPYFAWLLFAAYLNLASYLLNR